MRFFDAIDTVFQGFASLGLLLFIGVFLTITLLFVGRRFTGFLVGVIKVLWRFLTVPFRYVRHCCLRVTYETGIYEPVLSGRAILYRRLLSASEGVIVAGAILILTIGLLVAAAAGFPQRAVNEFKGLTAKINETLLGTAELRSEKAELEAQLKDNDTLQKAIGQQRQNVIDKKLGYEKKRDAGIAAGFEEKPVWSAVRDYLAQNDRRALRAPEIERIMKRTEDFYGSRDFPEQDLGESRQLLVTWQEWRQESVKLAKMENENPTERIQSRLAEIDLHLASLKKAENQLREERSKISFVSDLRFGRALAVSLWFLGSFVLFVWSSGLVTEGLRLILGMFEDVSAIRQLSASRERSEQEIPMSSEPVLL